MTLKCVSMEFCHAWPRSIWRCAISRAARRWRHGTDEGRQAWKGPQAKRERAARGCALFSLRCRVVNRDPAIVAAHRCQPLRLFRISGEDRLRTTTGWGLRCAALLQLAAITKSAGETPLRDEVCGDDGSAVFRRDPRDRRASRPLTVCRVAEVPRATPRSWRDRADWPRLGGGHRDGREPALSTPSAVWASRRQNERFCNSTVVCQNGGFVTWIQIQAVSTTFSSVARPSCAGYVTTQNG
jgi:hypothetical protein